jgi:hypothetical protein
MNIEKCYEAREINNPAVLLYPEASSMNVGA